MTDIYLADILSWLQAHASGSAKAKPRHLLLAYLKAQGYSGGDRGMRKSYGQGGPLEGKVGSSLKGIFFIVTADDRIVAQRTLHAPAMASLVRESEIRKAAPCGQIELFEEGR
jgi:hypothetical protein